MKLQWQNPALKGDSTRQLVQVPVLLAVAAVFSMALSFILAAVFYLGALPIGQGILLCLFILLVLEGLSRIPRISIPIFLVLLLFSALYLYIDADWRSLVQNAAQRFNDRVLLQVADAWTNKSPLLYSEENRRLLFLILVGVTSLVSYFVVRLFRQASLMLILLVLCAAQAEFQQLPNILLPSVIASLCAFFILGQNSQVADRQLRLPLLRILALVLAAVILNRILPADFLYNADLDRFLREKESRLAQASEPINHYSFSLTSAGYYPKSNELGGPINLSDTPYAEVTAQASAFYLRGAVYGVYTGRSWIQAGGDSGWLFDSPEAAALRAETFMLNPPEWAAEISQTGYYRFRPLLQPQQSILVAGNPLTIQFLDPSYPIRAFFNSAGTIYTDKNLPEAGYQIDGPVLYTSSVSYEALLNSLLLAQGDAGATMAAEERAYWLALPETVSGGLSEQLNEISNAFVNTDESDLHIALALKERLSSAAFTYELDVPEFPQGREFVDWFFEQRSGYCTYFATALTVLSRQAGIPARYVEGYVVPAAGGAQNMESTRTLTGRQAHAWTEIWVDGVGWLALDATPAAYQEQLRVPGEEAADEAAGTTASSSTNAQGETATSSTAAMEESVESAPSGSKSEVQNNPSEDLASRLRFADVLRVLLPFLFLLACAAAIYAFVRWRQKQLRNWHDLHWQLERHHDDKKALLLWVWQDIRYLAKLHGLKQEDGQTIRQYLQSWPKELRLYDTADLAEAAIYGQSLFDEDDLEKLMAEYAKLEAQTRAKLTPLVWVLRRFLYLRF